MSYFDAEMMSVMPISTLLRMGDSTGDPAVAVLSVTKYLRYCRVKLSLVYNILRITN